MIKRIEELLKSVKGSKVSIAVAGGDDEDLIKALVKSNETMSIKPILIGKKSKIDPLVYKVGLKIYDIIECEKGEEGQIATSLVLEEKADLLMKGSISSSLFLKSILDKDRGLRVGNLLSHVSVFEVPNYNRLLLLTDGGMNIAPTLKEKVDIITNSLDVAKALGIENPKVAVLAAVEVVSDNMPATIDAAILSKMNERDQIKGCIIDGPLALDGAISKEAAEHKGIKSKVAGEADILLVPDIEAGNLLGKSFTYIAGGFMAGVVMGAKVPAIMSSRADNFVSKLASIALAVSIAKRDSINTFR